MESKPTVKVLILEDDEARIKRFKRGLIPHNDFFFQLTVTDNVQHALELVRHNVFDLVFIDNDLCAQHYDQPMFSEGEKGTGIDFAKQVVDKSNAKETTLYIVHSLNFPAAGRIISVLKSAGLPCLQKPFAWNTDELASVVRGFAIRYKKQNR